MLQAISSDNSSTKESELGPQKYSVGQRVEVVGWTQSSFGKVECVERTFHMRIGEYVWGYKIKYEEGNLPPLTMTFVPQGYLRSCDQVVATEKSN